MLILFAFIKIALYLLIQLQSHAVATTLKCDELLQSENWLSDDGSIVSASSSTRWHWEPCPPLQNSSDGLEMTGMCVLCSSVTRILACVGNHVTHLPKPEELPPVVDIYQVANSDVRVIHAESFYNKTVREIFIENNVISVMSQKAFDNIIGLKVLSLANNDLPNFYISTVDELPELEVLILDDNGFEFSGSGDFIKSNSLSSNEEQRYEANELSMRMLSLAKNPLKSLPRYGFTWLANSPFTYLSLRGCSIQSAHEELDLSDVTSIGLALFNVTMGLKNGVLQHLALSSSGLVRIPNPALIHVAHSLTGLTLQGNNFQKIRKGDFPEMPLLQTIDLRRSSIIVLDDGAFNGLAALDTLYLSENRLAVVHSPFIQLNKLTYLDMSGNPDTIFSGDGADFTLEEDSFKGLTNLTVLNLSNSKLQKLRDKHFLPITKLEILALCNTEIKNVDDQPFRNLRALQKLDLSGSCSITEQLDDDVFYGLIRLIELRLTDSNFDFTREVTSDYFSHLVDLQNLILTYNKIRILYSNSFVSLKLLDYVKLDGNRIESWQYSVFGNNTNLRELSMKNNHLSYITDVMLEEFRGLEYLVLHDNPLQCDCNMEKFVLEIAMNSNTIVENWNKKSSPLKCYDSVLKINIDLVQLPEYNMCAVVAETSPPDIIPPVDPTMNIAILASVCFISLVVLLVIIAVGYRKRNNLRYFALMVRSTMAAALMEDQDLEEVVIYIYDVFVSYCEADRDWVIEKLLPSLEREAQLRVCLHERDFQPGYGILDNIIHCIDKSKSLLFVVSTMSLKSQWCKFEMHLAQHRFVETNRDKFILVLMSDIPKYQRPRTLHYLMATRTYLIWDPEHSNLFWKRLKKSLLINASHSSVV
ncbi:hypothetical protein B566_EDAN008189 [Ephemera danica]|nr:hypothetical protein B566_EDAN008189 [Ephemera danica]